MSVVGRLRPALLRGGAAASAAALGAAYYQRLPESHGDHRSAWSEGTGTRVYRTFLWPLVAQLDPEDAHLAALRAGQAWQAARACLEALKELPLAWLVLPAPSQSVPSGPALRQALFGGRLCFESPVGLAAGFDKNGLLVPLYRLGALPGLGFAEVGSVSAQPAAGNPRPRCWRVPSDEAVINFMGLNNDGAEAVAERLAAGAARGGAPVGVNIAKTHSPSILGDEAVQDFVASFRRLARHADFVVLNVSCPNTTEGKTFEEPSALRGLLEAIARERPGAAPPVLVKLVAPPDTPEGRGRLRELVGVLQASGAVDGLVLSNTVPDRDALSEQGRAAAAAAGARGGLSGPPLRSRSTAAIRAAYEQTGGTMPIIGVGGVDSAEAAYAKIRAGASLVEVYTGLVYSGPGLLQDLHVGIRRLLEKDGFSCISEAVGADVRLAAR